MLTNLGISNVNSTTKQNTNLANLHKKSNDNNVICNLPILIKEVNKALLKSNKEDFPVKYKEKKYIGKDSSGCYIM